MKVMILAGGLGTRLRPITYEIPKPLVPVKKKPIINHLIDFFHRSKVDEIGVLTSRMHEPDFERWRKMWREEMPDEKITVFYEEVPRGTFGGFGMEQVRDWIGNKPFLVSNGDELKEFDLRRLIDFHSSHDGTGTLALVEVPNPQHYGVPVMDGTKIVEFLEKPENPPSNHINSGLYMYNPEVFTYADFSKEKEIMSEKHIFPQLARAGKLHGIKLDGRWYDCGTLERWEKAIKEW